MAVSTNSPCWCELPRHILASIAKRLLLIEDFVAFRGVCVSWRQAATKECFDSSLPKLPILMLVEKGESDDREFFSLSRDKMCLKMALPEAKMKVCLESKGWLITVGWKGEMHLLHPFSRTQIELPHISTIKDYSEEYLSDEEPHELLNQAELSCSPFESSDFVVMINAGTSFALDFCRLGDKVWIRIDAGGMCLFSDVTFFNGLFYFTNYVGNIWASDICGSSTLRTRMITQIDNFELYAFKKAYLVESCGELLVVFRNGISLDDEDNYGATHFEVVRLDLNKSQGGWTVIKSLGNMSVFVGHSSSFSIDTNCYKDSMIKPNCIYFTDDVREIYYDTPHGGGKDMGIYHLQDGVIERFPNFQSLHKITPPLFITPYF